MYLVKLINKVNYISFYFFINIVSIALGYVHDQHMWPYKISPVICVGVAQTRKNHFPKLCYFQSRKPPSAPQTNTHKACFIFAMTASVPSLWHSHGHSRKHHGGEDLELGLPTWNLLCIICTDEPAVPATQSLPSL